MPGEEIIREELSSYVQDIKITLTKFEAIRTDDQGDFDSKNIRGQFVVSKALKLDGTHLSSSISLKVFGSADEKKFFNITVEYDAKYTLLRDLSREINSKDDGSLFSITLSQVDAIISPVIKSMGYAIKLG